MRTSRRQWLKPIGAAALVLAASASAASAQVTVQFFPSYGAEPTLGGPFNGAVAPFCTVQVPNISFASPGAFDTFVTANCPSAPAAFNGFNFGARFTGNLQPTAAGTFAFGGTSDDGFSLFINGTQVFDRWFDQSGSVGTANVALAAGLNPFQLDYYANTFGTSFVTLNIPTNVAFAVAPAQTIPEPSTYLLLGSGLLAIGAVARRRARAA